MSAPRTASASAVIAAPVAIIAAEVCELALGDPREHEDLLCVPHLWLLRTDCQRRQQLVGVVELRVLFEVARLAALRTSDARHHGEAQQ